MDTKAAEILHFEIRRDVVSLYKRFLNVIEDLRQEHQAMVKKLEKNLPTEYHNFITDVDYFDDSKFTHLRKKILDSGNESIRGIQEQLEQFDIGFGIKG